MVVQDKPNYRDISQGETGSSDRKQRLRERFEVVKKLGQGTYGKVQLAISKDTKQEVAIKTIKKAKIENEQDLVRIRREIQIMSSIHHPHIIHIYEVFENPEKIVLIMQYASGGELYDYLGCRKKLDENEARRVFRQVASAIFYCHKNRICHRDLKLENILLDDRGNAKIADFGLSNVFDERYKLKTFCGSPLYASPEIVRGTPYNGPEVDCWSLGVLLYTLVYGAMPFDGSNFKRLVKQISEGEYFEPKEKSGASGLIRRLLTVDINHRATIRDICSDWWVNQGYDHSLLKVASDMANLTPVRLDLLLALSSATTKTADQSEKKQNIKTTEQRTENTGSLCNGYYSKSHPLHVPENGGSRRRIVTAADDYAAYAGVTKQRISNVVNSSKERKEELIDHQNGYEYFPPAEVRKMSTKVQASDKNESNTFIIVQDLLKDVISKVEQHINTTKMEFLRSNTTNQTHEKPKTDSSVPQTNTICLDSRMHSGATEYEGKVNTVKVPIKSESVHISPEEQNSNRFVQKTSATTAKTSTVGLNAVTERCKISGVVTRGVNEADVTSSPEKTSHRDIFCDRRSSIPNKSGDLSGRNATVKLMEPDVVIPIFNVCCNIPKRSLDQARPPAKDASPKDTPLSAQSKLNDSASASKNSGVKLNVQPSEIRHSSNTCENSDSADVKNPTSPGGQSEKAVSFTRAFENRGSMSESGNSGTETTESSSEAPKLPPRKRFLIKIPKPNDIGSSHSESGDSKKIHDGIKQESKVSKEEMKKSHENSKTELQKVVKDLNTVPFAENEILPLLSDGDISSIPSKVTTDVESSPKLSERKSRKDSSRRSSSFSIKAGINKESNHVTSEKQNTRINEEESPEAKTNLRGKEFNNPNVPCDKPNEHNEAINQLPEEPIDQSSDTTSKQSVTGSSVSVEEEPSKLQEYATTKVGETEMPESETKTIDSFSQNDKFDQSRRELNSEQTTERRNIYFTTDAIEAAHQRTTESQRSRTLVRSKHRSLSRTRAMSLEFESLALMPMRIVRPPQKPPGKVEIPKTFDPTQPVTSPKVEMREIIFIPTACVSENKEKIQKKIEKVKKAAIVIPPRRKSDAGVANRKKKYTRSQTDFIPRSGDFVISVEDGNLIVNGTEQDSEYQNEEAQSTENMDGEVVPNEMWYSAISPDTELEECEQRFKVYVEQGGAFDGFYHESDVAADQSNQLHRHSVDTESGYWTPPEMGNGERFLSQTATRIKDEKILKRHDTSEKIMLQRAAFKNSKLRMKLSDEGLDMCSLSSSLESGIYSWRQEDVNGKRISPDSESALKVLRCEMTSDGSYAPIARSFKKMTFPPEYSSTSELSENCYIVGDSEKSLSTDAAAVTKNIRNPKCSKLNGVDSTKPIKSSDSQSSYGSNDISDDVFENWVDKEDALIPKGKQESHENSGDLDSSKNSGRNTKARNWQRGETWNSYSTDKESSENDDNDDDLDLMVDDSHQLVYGTEGLWQFLKSVNQNLSNQLKTASKKTSKLACHRSKSQESKHPDDVASRTRPVTRSLSREEKQKKGGTQQLRHFVSEGKLADSTDCFEDTRFNDTRYSSGYMASGSSLNDSGMLHKDFMNSVDSFHNHSDDISLYGTLRKDKYFHSSSALSSPYMTRRKKSLQYMCSSGDLSSVYDDATDIADDELSKHSAVTEQNRKLSIYGTLRSKHLSQQGKAQSQILLSTDDGYQLLYNDRSKTDSSVEQRYGSMGTLRSSVTKATSELNVKDYEKLLLTDEDTLKRPLTRNTSNGEKSTSRVKKIVSEKGNRRVSFSSDVKASKSDYHSSLRQNSINKVREANEELSSSHKSNTYEEEQDSGSLLEALKTYGYRGIISQKLQSSPDVYEQPRLSYRLPTEGFLSTGLSMTNWDNFEYMPMENTLAYQQPIYSSVDPMEYYQYKPITKGSPMRRNIADYTDFSCDDDTVFFRSHRLSEDDVLTRKKPLHRPQDMRITHGDQYTGENWDAKAVRSSRKKSLEGCASLLNSERRNSGSEKILQQERERDNGENGEPKTAEPRGGSKMENTIEALSEKIQALKSRCQRKSVDESNLKKQLDESGIALNETQEKSATSDVENERVNCYTDPLDELESESSESVSDRIWRKSFYKRFNDVSTGRRKKSSSFMDSEFLNGHNFFRSSGKFNIDEEGGMEEPWMSTSLKRRNSQFRRSLSRQPVGRSPSLNQDAKDYDDYSKGYHKHGVSSSDTEYKRSLLKERSLSQSSTEEQKKPKVYNRKTLSPTKVEADCLNSSDYNVSLQERKENRTDEIALENNKASDASKTDLNDSCPTRNSCDQTENQVSSLATAVDNIPEIKSKVTDRGLAAGSDISANEPLKMQKMEPKDAASPASAELNPTLEENSEMRKTEDHKETLETDDNQKTCDGIEVHKE